MSLLRRSTGRADLGHRPYLTDGAGDHVVEGSWLGVHGDAAPVGLIGPSRVGRTT